MSCNGRRQISLRLLKVIRLCSLECSNRATRSFDGAISRRNRNSLPSVVTLATLRIDDRARQSPTHLQALTGYVSGPTLAAAVSQAPPIQAGSARVWFLRQFEPGESLATPFISANGVPVGESLPGTVFLRDFTPGTYTFTVPSYGVDFGQAATVQLAAGTQTYLEVQSLRSWAGAGGDDFERDTLYVRAISPYWADKYFPTLRYLGQG